MFAAACEQYGPLLAQVGFGGGARGMGVFVLPGIIATAKHVLQEPNVQIMSSDGFYQSEAVINVPGRDISLVRLGEMIRPIEHGCLPFHWPKIASEKPRIGATLGYVTRLQNSGVNAFQLHFACVHVSTILIDEDEPRILLTGATVERGMSGSPVFDRDAQLHGLIAQSANGLPIMVPLFQLAGPIAELARRERTT